MLSSILTLPSCEFMAPVRLVDPLRDKSDAYRVWTFPGILSAEIAGPGSGDIAMTVSSGSDSENAAASAPTEASELTAQPRGVPAQDSVGAVDRNRAATLVRMIE